MDAPTGSGFRHVRQWRLNRSIEYGHTIFVSRPRTCMLRIQAELRTKVRRRKLGRAAATHLMVATSSLLARNAPCVGRAATKR